MRNVAAHRIGRWDGLDATDEAVRLSALIDGLGLRMTLGREGDGAERAIAAIDRHLGTLGIHAG